MQTRRAVVRVPERMGGSFIYLFFMWRKELSLKQQANLSVEFIYDNLVKETKTCEKTFFVI